MTEKRKVGRPRTYNDFQVATKIQKDVYDKIAEQAAKDGNGIFTTTRNILTDWARK